MYEFEPIFLNHAIYVIFYMTLEFITFDQKKTPVDKFIIQERNLCF